MASGGSAELLRNILPTEEILRGWSTIEDARAWSQLPEETLGEIMAVMGSRTCTNLVIFAGLDPMVLKHAAAETQVDGRNLTPIERVLLGMTYNAARQKFKLELVDIVAGPAPMAPAPPPPHPVMQGMSQVHSINPLKKVKLCNVIDQASDGEVEMLPAGVLEDLKRQYRAVMGSDPPKEEAASNGQLTCLYKVVEIGNAPNVDMGIWKPNGDRIERAAKFKVQVRDTNGDWRSVEVSGPPSYEEWEKSWLVFKTAAISLSLATPTTLDAYARRIREMAKEFPQAWYLLVQTDSIMRAEEWSAERRKLERQYDLAPALSSFNKLMPWDSVIRHAADWDKFWEKHYEKHAHRAETRGEPATNAFKHDSLYSSVNSPWEPPLKGTKRPYEDAGGDAQDWRPAKKGKGKGDGKKQEKNKAAADNNDQQRGDGRYYKSVEGCQICFDWTRVGGGCQQVCPTGRAHCCEFCRGSHRTINCPKHPGWKPSAPEKKGSGGKGNKK